MKAIWKFKLAITDSQDVMMPLDAEIISAQNQPGVGLCLWAICDTSKPTVRRRIDIFGTGNAIEFEFPNRFIGTVQEYGGALVWHVFERI
ncbi:MAG TPA: hypothetical protein VNH19_20725 [Candidatus Limnocylindrales bacterium]|nr:hypothetical protein [Candidatus Limnocylindrales bacterium]